MAPGTDRTFDDALDVFPREKLKSAYHPCETCRMGTDDTAVTRPDGRVRGMAGLRVIDASVMPQALAGVLDAPTLVRAKRISDLIRGRHLPDALGAPIMAAVRAKAARGAFDGSASA